MTELSEPVTGPKIKVGDFDVNLAEVCIYSINRGGFLTVFFIFSDIRNHP